MKRINFWWLSVGLSALTLLGSVLWWRIDPGNSVKTDVVVQAAPVRHLAFLEDKNEALDKKKPAAMDAEMLAALEQHIQKLLASTIPEDHNLVFSTLLPSLARENPVMAGQLVDSIAQGPLRTQATSCLVQVWAVEDPKAAESWAAQLSNSDERNLTLTWVCFKIAEVDAPQALTIAEAHGLSNAPGGVVENLVQQWAGQDFSSALSWTRELPAGAPRDDMMLRLACVEAQTAPAKAAQMVTEEIPPGPAQEEAAMTVVAEWGSRDLPGATAWVNLFPEGSLRDRAEDALAGIRARTARN